MSASIPRLVACTTRIGASLLAPRSCIALRIDWRDAAGVPASVDLEPLLAALSQHPRLQEQGLEAMPPLHVAGERGTSVTWLATLLQRAVGHEPPELPGLPAGAAALAIPCWDLDTGLLAARSAFALVASSPDRRPPRDILDSFFRQNDRIALRTTAVRLIRAAERRGIPWRRVLPGLKVVQLGHGARQQRILNSRTPHISYVASYLQQRKEVTTRLLRASGLPAPRNRRVATPDEAVRAAEALGYPVVVKPADGAYGKGVVMGNATAEAVRAAYATAAATKQGAVLVEQQIAGTHHRLLVMQGRFLSAVRQDPPCVIGDGQSDVRTLVHQTNIRRSGDRETAPVPIRIDREVIARLAQDGLAAESVPAAGQRVVLRHGSNISGGGTAQNVTALVHPEVRFLAERAAALLGLDLAGIDFITPDVARPYSEVGGAICEINAGPDLFMREPDELIERSFLDHLFPRDDRGRIPVIVLLDDGTPGLPALAGRLARAAWQGGQPGLAVVASGGLQQNARRLAAPELGYTALVEAALAEPSSSALLLVVQPKALETAGLGVDSCDLALLPDQASGSSALAAAALLRSVAARTLAPGEEALSAALALLGISRGP